MINTEYKSAYAAHVSNLQRRLQKDEALRQAVGGEFIAVGKLEHYLLRSLGLADGHLIVDVGCGSGRLACQLAPFRQIRYVGCDVVPQLVSYARELSAREDWRFLVTDGAKIPIADECADFLAFFSVFTHLLHEDTYRYFHEARRCLKPAGRFVFSFLEFRVPCHWDTFIASVHHTPPGRHLNQFIDRDAIQVWASHNGLAVEGIWDGDKGHFPIPEEIVWENGLRMSEFGNLGQSVAVLRRKA